MAERRGTAGVSAAALIALSAWAFSMLLPESFWIMDEAFNYLSVEALHADPFTIPPAIAYPGSEAAGDAAESLRPLPHHYGFMRDGMLYSQYTPSLAIASLPFRAIAGRSGTMLLPALSLGAIVLLLGRMLRERGFDGRTAVAVLLAGTPLLFYSQTIWGHLPAIALCAGAWAAHRRGSTALPALLLLPACLLREECLLFVPLLAFRRGWGRAASGAAAAALVAAAFLVLQRLATGSWIGTHLQASGTEADLYGFASAGFIERKVFVLRTALLSCLPGAGQTASALAGLMLWATWAMSRDDSRRSMVLTAAGCVFAALAALLPAFGGFALFSLFELKHPLVIFPAMWLAGRPGRGWMAPAAVFGAVLMAMEPMHVLDAAWGMRLLIPAGLMFVAVSARPGRKAWAALAAGAVITCVSLGFLVSRRSRSASLVQAAEEHGGAVIATSWELPGEFARLQSEGTPVLFADSALEFAAALEALSGLDPVVVSPAEDVPTAVGVAGRLGWRLVPVFSVRFDPSLEAVVLDVEPSSREDTQP